MTMKKRLGALSLALVMTVSVLSGCSNGSSSSSSSSGSGASSSSGSVAPMDLAGVTDPYLATAGVAGDTVVATVGDVDVTADNLLYWVAYTADNAMNYYSSIFGMTELPWDTESEGKTMRQTVLDSALQTAALYAILPHKGEQESLAVSQESLDSIANSLVQMSTQLGSQEQLDHYLWQYPMTADLYTFLCVSEEINSLILSARFGEGAPGYPTDAEVTTYVQEVEGIAYRAKHILLKTVDTNAPILDESGKPTGEYEPLDEAAVAAQRALAEDLLGQLRASSDVETLFDQLMQEHGQDEGVASNPDGYYAKAGQMVAPFEEAALALENGQVSDIVESNFGYHIILRLPIQPEKYRSQLINSKMTQVQQQWLEENPPVTTDAFDKLDPAAFYTQLNALRVSVAEEQQAAQGDGSASASGGASHTGGSSGSQG